MGRITSLTNKQEALSQPIVVSCGMGVDSTAMLILLRRQGVVPTAIVFADTGSEKPETYRYIKVLEKWLRRVHFPALTIVKNPSPRAGYRSLEENCVSNRTLPSIAYGFQRHSCSLTWKGNVIDRWLVKQPWAQDAWRRSTPVTRLIGYDDSCADRRRTFRVEKQGGDQRWIYRYPLQEYGLDRDACVALIGDEGLAVPAKSACFFCPAMRKPEILALAERHPRLVARALRMEALASHDYRSIKGLGGSFNWRAFLADERPELLKRLDRRFDTAKDLPARYAAGEEVWVPKRQRPKAEVATSPQPKRPPRFTWPVRWHPLRSGGGS